MHLTQPEVELFYKLWCTLLWGVNEKHGIVPKFKKPDILDNCHKSIFFGIRTQIWEKPEMIDDFLLGDYSSGLDESEREIIAGWRKHYVEGKFLILKHLAKYSVFMTFDAQEKLYGVCGISDSIEETVCFNLPILVKAVLIPFKGRIIYDSFFNLYNMTFGGGMKKGFNESYKRTKESTGIIVSMDEPAAPAKPRESKPKPAEPAPPQAADTKGANVPKAMSARYVEVAEIIEAFCDDLLDAEFKEICLRALAKLCRKRPSPVASGRARTWACGIVYAIGSINFVFDRSQPYYMPATDIAEWFGLAKSTAGSKSAEIIKLLNISYYDLEFSLQKIIKNRPWFL